MNYTKNYHLPQWEETDRVMRTDFNQMCADIDQGVAEAKVVADLAANSIHIGYYMGQWPEVQVTTGFRPKALVIFRLFVPTNDESAAVSRVSIFLSGESYSKTVRFQDDGFVVVGKEYSYPDINTGRNEYAYIAFR